MMVDEVESSLPEIEQHYSSEVEAAIRAALTDADLFDSYKQSAKSIEPLEAALAKAPGDVRLNQRLAVLYRRANRLPDAARCCVVLQKMFDAHDHPDRAREFASLATKYAEQAGVRVPDVDIRPYLSEKQATGPAPTTVEHEFAIEVEGPEPAAQPSINEFDLSAPAEAAEIDISGDWDAAGTPAVEADENGLVEGAPRELVEEVQFYLAQSLWDEAQVALQKLSAVAPAFPSCRSGNSASRTRCQRSRGA